jgi:hypothetical protein
MTPHEAFTGQRPNVAHLREFGSDVWILDQRDGRSKLDPKARKFAFVGYEEGPKAIRYYDASGRAVRVSRNFKFAEDPPAVPVIISELPLEGGTKTVASAVAPIQTVHQPPPIIPATSSGARSGIIPPAPPPPIPPNQGTIPRREIPPSETLLPIERRSGRLATKPDIDYYRVENPDARTSSTRLQQKNSSQLRNEGESAMNATNSDDDDEYNRAYFMTTYENTPTTVAEARASPEWSHWNDAMHLEYATLFGMGTWEFEEVPANTPTIGCMWTFVKKLDEQGNIASYKARLVALGNTQKPGQYGATFSPVVRLDSVRIGLAIAAAYDWEIEALDIKGAFLNATLEERIYMRQPEGFNDKTGRVCRLIKTIYGLKQSGRNWNLRLDNTLTKHGFKRLESDHCVYIRHIGDATAILFVWVDDILICANSVAELEKVKSTLEGEFEVKFLGLPRFYLGIEVTRERSTNSISLSQSTYVNDLLHRFKMDQSTPVSTPMNPSVSLAKHDSPVDQASSSYYAVAIGSLLYAAMCTRPDIAFAVNTLAQFTSNPGEEHWTAVKRVMRYLKGTHDYSLTYSSQGEKDWSTDVVGYSDADWGSDHVDRKSISGYTFMIGDASISWSSKKQATVALSSTEAEYVAASHATTQAIWLRQLLKELRFPQSKSTIIRCDNQSAIALARDAQFHARTKHIDIRHHFIRDKLEDGTIDIIYCSTNDMLADILTKGLAKPKHEYLRSEIGVRPA